MTSQEYQVHLNDVSRDWRSNTLLRNLTLQTVQKPELRPGTCLVRMRAAALNFRDLLVLSNSDEYPLATVPGLVPCSDGAGEIEEICE